MAGGSKCSIGMVSQCWIGSAPPCWDRQNRSISTSHIGRSPSRGPLELLEQRVVLAEGSGDVAESVGRGDAEVAELRASVGPRTSTSFSNIARPSSSPADRWAVWPARLVAALASTTRSPVLIRLARVCP
jgi:hypothetical protein